jgi:hypothetical protein
MVAMGVRKEYGIKTAYVFAEHLLAEVGPGVYYEALAVDGHVYRGAQSFIAIVQ